MQNIHYEALHKAERYDVVIFILAREYTQSTGVGLYIINVIVISL